MSDRPDDSQKTEEPTSKRLEDARKKGDAAKSTEVSNWFMLVAGTLVIAFMAVPLSSSLSTTISVFLFQAHDFTVESGNILVVIQRLILDVVLILALPMGAFILAALAGNLVQNPPVFTTEKISPKLEKISPQNGIKRVFGAQALSNFLKGVAKLSIVGGIAAAITWAHRDLLNTVITLDLAVTILLVQDLAVKILIGSLAILSVVAGIDYLYQRYDFTKRQRMTKQEVKDEHRQMEGDPVVKAKLRQIRMERARQRMIAEVPTASVVITNPTHYAVALRYESGKMAAPVCVAKGADQIALRIREVASENDVPIVENPPLARALFGTVELEEEIPQEHYKAVAGVIGYVMRQRGKYRATAG